jgi:adenylate cyclase class IV
MENELKFRVSYEQAAKICQDLLGSGVSPSTPTIQTDDYYCIIKGKYYVRIRHLPEGRASLDVHTCISPGITQEDEKVLSMAEALKQITLMGFNKKICTVHKTRIVYRNPSQQFILCFDTVQNLGYFIEIEIESDNSCLELLWQAAQIFGLSKNQLVQGSGYPDLMIQ